jgi:hypothetical protein
MAAVSITGGHHSDRLLRDRAKRFDRQRRRAGGVASSAPWSI